MRKILFFISTFIIFGLLIGFNALAEDTIQVDDALDAAKNIIAPNPEETLDIDEGVDVVEEVTIDEDITAEDLGVSDQKTLPDSPLYSIKDFWRNVRTTFTFNPVKKVELRFRYANERLIEAKKLAEKTGKEEFVGKAVEKYQKEMERIRTRVEKFTEKAADNQKIDKFLDKFTEKSVKQQRLMDSLEKKLLDKPEVLEKIRENKERSLEHFGEVMGKLEEVDKIPERLEKNLEKIKGSEFKNFKNLEVLIRLEEKVPERAKEAIQQAQENSLKRLYGNLEQMSLEDQEKFGTYLDKTSGDQATQVRILERLNEKKPTPVLKQRINQNIERAQERVKSIQQDRVQIQEKSREETKEQGEEPKRESERVCITLWDPVCGKDGKTYSNSCFAKLAGAEIVHRGKCRIREIEKPTTESILRPRLKLDTTNIKPAE